ncbi:MAG: hypothetical protein CMJ46_10215 [Planctomyces sp.]|nr:hypothetical protein [Planctomyces sp.]
MSYFLVGQGVVTVIYAASLVAGILPAEMEVAGWLILIVGTGYSLLRSFEGFKPVSVALRAGMISRWRIFATGVLSSSVWMAASVGFGILTWVRADHPAVLSWKELTGVALLTLFVVSCSVVGSIAWLANVVQRKMELSGDEDVSGNQ